MRRLVLLVLLVVTGASCAKTHEGDIGGPATNTPDFNDPALTAAAALVQPLLEREFASTYAGLEMRGQVPMMIVYRKPDPRLDAEVRKAALDVRIEFRDARYNHAEMMAHVKRVMDDTEHWEGRGVKIVFAGPEVDGSGVRVGVTSASDGVVRQLEEYYPAMSFNAEASGEIVPAPATRPPPVFDGTKPVFPTA